MHRIRIVCLLCSLILSSIAWQSHAASTSQNVYLPLIAVPPQVHLEHIVSLTNRGNLSYAEGEVINDTNHPLYNVTIEATFMTNGDTKQIATTTAITAFPATLPGQRNAFQTDQFGGNGTIWSFLHADITSWKLTSDHDYRAVTVIRKEPCAEGFYWCIELRNDYSRTLKDITILLGYPIDDYEYHWQKMSEPLAPGETRVYRFGMPAYWPSYDLSQIWSEAQGELVP